MRAQRPSLGHVPALDGIRALAVSLVLLFHLAIPGLSGGFVGVDVFFVLSGFLITSLLLAEVDASGRVSLIGFWLRRARRLLPALAILLLAVAVVAALDSSVIGRGSLRGDLLSTTAYVANWHFISASSYFASNGVSSPLQHAWSLAIEEQFYFVWPIVIAVVAWAFRRRNVRHVVIAWVATAVAVASALALARMWREGLVERAYMGTDARIFEPLLGAMGAVAVTTGWCRRALARHGRRVTAIGAVLLAGSFVLVTTSPGSYHVGGAGAVAVASLLMIAPLWTGGSEGVLWRTLTLRPVVWLGVVSYGVYLWHWPMVVWLRPQDSTGVDAVGRGVLVVALTVGAAAASYYLIERPIRRGRRSRSTAPRHARLRPGLALALVPVTLVGIAGISVAATRVPPPDPSQPVVMLVGDSVPLHLGPAFEREAERRGWRVVMAAQGACNVAGDRFEAFVGGRAVTAPRCRWTVDRQNTLIRQYRPDVVVW